MGYLDQFKLADKVAVVSGGSKGLGRAMAIGLGDVGAKVVVVSRSKDLIKETANIIVQNGGKAMAIPVDVNNHMDTENMVQRVMEEHGRIDILINNAGISNMHKSIDVSEEDWDGILNTNLKSLFFMSKTVAKTMIVQKSGKIINIGSVLGKMATNVSPHYCATKAGVAHLTRAHALEWSRFNINVNCIAPGFFETEMTKEQQEDEAHMNFLRYKIPFKRLGKPEEIVGTAIWLSSEASNYVTGAVIYVDGGYTIW
jgi:NAD(P)-dependent dehydrogenase (short-subunit alcohol dehydrogenase family)